MLIYVYGHELTHVLWTWAMGGRVKKFKASSTGGQVVVTKTNFLIALAPYFFPLYAVLVVLVFLVLDRFWEWRWQIAWFHLLLGAAYALSHYSDGPRAQEPAIGYHGPGLPVFRGGHLPREHRGAFDRGAAADRQGGVAALSSFGDTATEECLLWLGNSQR